MYKFKATQVIHNEEVTLKCGLILSDDGHSVLVDRMGDGVYDILFKDNAVDNIILKLIAGDVLHAIDEVKHDLS